MGEGELLARLVLLETSMQRHRCDLPRAVRALALVLSVGVGGCGAELPRARGDGQVGVLLDGLASSPDGGLIGERPDPDGSSSDVGAPAFDASAPDASAPDAPPTPDSAPPQGGFGYPVGDGTTYPAGGWVLWQNLSHYWSAYNGRHLGHDVSLPGGAAAIGKPVLSVADGTVLYAKPNGSSYKNVVLIEHWMADGTRVCSFYAHINTPQVKAGDVVTRGQPIATIRDWSQCVSGGAKSNSHLHYVLLNDALCAKVALTGTAGASGVCGYDKGGPHTLGRVDLQNEPFYYTAVNDACGNHKVPDGFISPTQFIDAHHF